MSKSLVQKKNTESEMIRIRNCYALSEDYGAGLHFAHRVSWHAEAYGGVLNLYNGDLSSNMKCSVVGVMCQEGLHLENHGNFDPDSEPKSNLSDASFTFSLRIPDSRGDEKIFHDDFVSFVSNVRKLARSVSKDESASSPFIKVVDGEIVLCFVRRVFRRLTRRSAVGRVSASIIIRRSRLDDTRDPITPAYLSGYDIRMDLRHRLQSMRKNFIARRFCLKDKNGDPIQNGQRYNALCHQLVRVIFFLRFDPEVGMIAEFHAIEAFTLDQKA